MEESSDIGCQDHVRDHVKSMWIWFPSCVWCEEMVRNANRPVLNGFDTVMQWSAHLPWEDLSMQSWQVHGGFWEADALLPVVFAHTLGILAEAWPVLLRMSSYGWEKGYMVAPILRYQPRHEQTEAFGQASGSLESRKLFKHVRPVLLVLLIECSWSLYCLCFVFYSFSIGFLG